ncbi:MAG: hypothetical protein AAF849_04830 [Bacteroidota bacterium]
MTAAELIITLLFAIAFFYAISKILSFVWKNVKTILLVGFAFLLLGTFLLGGKLPDPIEDLTPPQITQVLDTIADKDFKIIEVERTDTVYEIETLKEYENDGHPTDAEIYTKDGVEYIKYKRGAPLKERSKLVK